MTAPVPERLRGVYSFRAAMPVLDAFAATIPIDDDHPAILWDWHEDHLDAFVAAANCLEAARAPQWLRTRPPAITRDSFIDDVFHFVLRGVENRRYGNVMVAPNDIPQTTDLVVSASALQDDMFLQEAMETALPIVDGIERFLAVTYYLVDARVQRAQPNNILCYSRHGVPMRRLFI